MLEQLKNEYDADKALLFKISRLLGEAPEGNLRSSLINGHVRFYRTKDGKSSYMRKEEENLASQLAHKEYLMKLEQALDREIHVIGAFLKRYQPSLKKTLFHSLHPAKQKLVTPLLLPDEAFAESWKNNLSESRNLTPNSYPMDRSFQTKEGSAVRSKSEKIIADLLFDSGVPYVYEAPLYGKRSALFPDFTMLNVRTRTTVYWEHFGMMDHAEYTAGIPQKLNAYEAAGVRLGETLIVTFETSASPIDVKSIKGWITRMLL